MVDDIFLDELKGLNGSDQQMECLLRAYNYLAKEHNSLCLIIGDCQVVATPNRIQSIADLIRPLSTQVYDPLKNEFFPFNRDDLPGEIIDEAVRKSQGAASDDTGKPHTPD